MSKASSKKHTYIDRSILRNFENKYTLESIVDDIVNKYKITNINEDYELALMYLGNALLSDIEYERANYKAYIEEGMNARMLMALRTIAIMPLGDGFDTAYQECSTCETPKDVSKIRLKYFKRLTRDYDDLDWQYYYIAKYFLRSKAKDLDIDFEICYNDYNMDDYTTPDHYQDSLLCNNMPEHLYESKYPGRDRWKAYIKT